MSSQLAQNQNIELGLRGERAVAEHLLRERFTIVEQNWRTPLGEVDLIALDKKTLVFVEVKTRNFKVQKHYNPFEVVTHSKQRKLIELAELYICKEKAKIKGLGVVSFRFDVIGVNYSRNEFSGELLFDIHHLRGAFDASQRYGAKKDS